MRMSKKLQRLLLSSLAVGAVTFTPVIYNFDGSQFPVVVSVAHAEIKAYTGVGEGITSDIESPAIAKLRARADAMNEECSRTGRRLLEELFAYN